MSRSITGNITGSIAGLPAYAELHCLSNFTFLTGASHPAELVERARALGYSAMAITDECSVAGMARAHVAAKKIGLKLIVGSRFTLCDAEGHLRLRLILLACNREGYGNLCELITLGRMRAQKGSYQLMPDDIATPPDDLEHLAGMPDCLAILLPEHGVDAAALQAQLRWCKSQFDGRLWVAMELLMLPGDDRHRTTVAAVAQECAVPVVASGAVVMHKRSRKPIQDMLTAIRLGQPLAACGLALAPNAEQHLRSRLRLAQLYTPDMMRQSVLIAERCNVDMDNLRYEYPREVVPAGHTPVGYLRERVEAGAQWRYPKGVPAEVRESIEKELGLIRTLEYESYFLTVYDIVSHARSIGILCQGRGSAANSVVCFCLGITEVDPARSRMLFARFLSAERNEPPDIDVDFEHQRREEVIQYIYDKYGRDRTALAASLATYRSRSALRDVGKALGVDAGVIEQVAKAQAWWDGKQAFIERLALYGMNPDAPVVQRWAELVETVRGFPRHLSQHVGGFVIARDKLTRLVPVENAAMPERSVIQWDKDDLEALGLLKVDVLALGMLSALQRALHMLSERRGAPFGLQDMPEGDVMTYDMICRADTIGVFQIESRAQQSMLPRLRPREFYDLVVQVAIVRPGPIQGGMVHPYLERRKHPKSTDTYQNADIRAVLERTRGVPIFQEQVMELSIVAAGFSPGDADNLRRAMGAWKRKGGLEHYQQKLVAGMLDRGYALDFAQRICKQIEGFGEYGFPESHAASFALLVYASSWIKCHEPSIFLASLLNSQPMGFYSPSQLIQDAQRHGVQVLPVDVMYSDWESTLEGDGPKPAVRLGMHCVQGMREDAAVRIEAARMVQPFDSLQDLVRRAMPGRHALHALAAADALAGLVGHRRQALWQIGSVTFDKDLLRDAPIHEEVPVLPEPRLGEAILSDYASLGLSLRAHPLALLRPRLHALRFRTAEQLGHYRNGRAARACGIVTVRQRPGTAKGTLFISIEDESGAVNVIVWPGLVERQRKEVLHATLLGVVGTWQCEGEVRHLVAHRLIDLSPLLGRLETTSRDFH